MSESVTVEETLSTEKKRCKHCKEWVAGGHDDRKAHYLSCPARAESKSKRRSSSEMDRTAASGSPSDESRPTTNKASGKKKMDTCTTCGVYYRIGTHDTEECKLKKGGATFLARKRTKEEVAASVRRKAEFDSRNVTPDVSEYDRKMKKLLQKTLPPIRTPSPNHDWALCTFCGKRLVRAYIASHEENSCVVKGVIRKFEQLKKNVTAKGEGPVKKDRLLLTLSPADATVEEARRLLAVIDAVVPIIDLFLDAASHLTPVVDPTPEDIRPRLDAIWERICQWRDDFQLPGDSPRSSRTHSPFNDDQVSPRSEDGKSRAESVATRRSGTSTRDTSSLPTLSAVLHGPRLHITEERARSVKSSERSAQLSITKTSRVLGGQGYNQEVDESELPPPRFDEHTLRLAKAIVAGEMTLEEALNPEKHKKVSRVKFSEAIHPENRV